MSRRDPYESWTQARSDADVPDDFADKVMAAVRQCDNSAARKAVLRGWLLSVLASRWARAAIWSVGFLACAVRIFFVLGLFLPA